MNESGVIIDLIKNIGIEICAEICVYIIVELLKNQKINLLTTKENDDVEKIIQDMDKIKEMYNSIQDIVSELVAL